MIGDCWCDFLGWDCGIYIYIYCDKITVFYRCGFNLKVGIGSDPSPPSLGQSPNFYLKKILDTPLINRFYLNVFNVYTYSTKRCLSNLVFKTILSEEGWTLKTVASNSKLEETEIIPVGCLTIEKRWSWWLIFLVLMGWNLDWVFDLRQGEVVLAVSENMKKFIQACARSAQA